MSTMAKTKSGRAKNYRCPYCDFPTYSIHNLNMHIATAHSGKATIAVKDKETVKVKQQKEFKNPEASAPKVQEKDPIDSDPDPDQDQDDDGDDLYG